MKENIQPRGTTVSERVISHQELTTALQAIARERLTQKQKKSLLVINTLQEDLPVTRVVQQLVKILACSETTIWNNLHQLKAVGMVSYGDVSTKGKPLIITSLGKIICKGLEV